MNAHITKPIEPGTIYRTIEKWVAPMKKAVSNIDNAVTEQKLELPNLPGIDVAAGVKRMRGNWASYKRILMSFRDKERDSVRTVAECIQHGKWDEAAHIAHALKGSGGNISADDLYKDAAALEQACFSKDIASVQPLLDALNDSLGVVIDGLMSLKNSPDQSNNNVANKGDADPDVLYESLDKLINLLDSDLGEAQSLLAKLQRQTNGSAWENAVDKMVAALNNFDVDTVKDGAHNIQVQCKSF